MQLLIPDDQLTDHFLRGAVPAGQGGALAMYYGDAAPSGAIGQVCAVAVALAYRDTVRGTCMQLTCIASHV